MSGSTTNLDLIIASQASKEVTANALFDASSTSAIFGRRASTTAALTWGYYGGAVMVGNTPTAVANGTIALTASATNYVQTTLAGVVSSNTTSFTAGQIPLYTIVTGAATVTSYIDNRALAFSAEVTSEIAQGLKVAEAANSKQGIAVLVAGTVTVANTSITANSRIFLTSQIDGGTVGFLRVSARVVATSFTITSSSAADTSTVAFEIFEPA